MNDPRRRMPRTGIRLLIAAAGVAAAVALTLAPRSIVAPARGAFMEFAYTYFAPLLEGITYTELEGTLNALLFVPLGAGIALVLPRRMWVLAPLLGSILSFGVEHLQVRIPGRVPDLDDVFWNSIGALAGAVVVALVRGIVWAARRPATAPPRPAVSAPPEPAASRAR